MKRVIERTEGVLSSALSSARLLFRSFCRPTMQVDALDALLYLFVLSNSKAAHTRSTANCRWPGEEHSQNKYIKVRPGLVSKRSVVISSFGNETK